MVVKSKVLKKGLFELPGRTLVSKRSAVPGTVAVLPGGYTAKYKSNGAITETPIPVIPVTYANTGVMHGLFVIGGELQQAPMGFVRQGLRDAYHVTATGKSRFEDGGIAKRLYVPLKRLEIEHEVPPFGGKAGVAYSMYGVCGAADDTYPVMLIAPGKGSTLTGLQLYENREGFMGVVRGVEVPFDRRTLEEHVRDLAPKTAISLSPSRNGVARRREQVDIGDPDTVVARLDRYVIGQDTAKESTAFGIMAYAARVRAGGKVELPRENILAVGPSGVGKNLTWEVLEQPLREAGIYVVTVPLTTIMPQGYKGHALSDVFWKVAKGTEGDAPHAVVVLDELCKLGDGRFGAQVQKELIGIVGAGEVPLTDPDGYVVKYLNTTNMLFVGLSAFLGRGGELSVYDRVARRRGVDNRVGLTEAARAQPQPISSSEITSSDLQGMGVATELMGRISAAAPIAYDHLTLDQQVTILRHRSPKVSPLLRSKNLFRVRWGGKYRLQVRKGVAEVMANHTTPDTGARILPAICQLVFEEPTMHPERYARRKVVEITPDLATEKLARLKNSGSGTTVRGGDVESEVSAHGAASPLDKILEDHEDSDYDPTEVPLPRRRS